MPLLSRGAFEHFEATPSGPAADEYGLTGKQPFTVLREVTRGLQPVPLTFAVSAEQRGIELTRLVLTGGSRVMLRRVADASTPLHVLCWSWDLSGEPPLVHPAPEDDLTRWQVPLSGEERRLDKAPLQLVPPRRVVGCQSVRVILWQSDRGADPAAVTDDVREALRHSRLASTLATLSPDARGTMMTAVGVREAAGELGREIAPVLRALCTDYVDFFEGFYPVVDDAVRADRFAGFHSELSLRM
ncbi:hypothetical protein ACFV3R_09475 [Streptomyces sp. NPDC059740]|uniref:hypothetical protein n=1 Tax=Streptomyces sp. NPDC059740 TaxID=3346926 RepID=UPI0036668226